MLRPFSMNDYYNLVTAIVIIAIVIVVVVIIEIISRCEIQSQFHDRDIVSGEIKIVSNVDFSRKKCVACIIRIGLIHC